MTNLVSGVQSGMNTMFVPFAKIDEEQRLVYGYASTEARDQQGEIVRRNAIEAALPEYMRFGNIREMHQPSAVGIAKEAEMDGKGLFLGAHVVDDRAWAKCKAGVYKGFSVGGRVTSRDPDDKTVITGLELTEISLVDRPANPEAIYTVVKRVDGKLKAQPVQKWDCGDPTHQHLAKDEASECMERVELRKTASTLKLNKIDEDYFDDDGNWFGKREFSDKEREHSAARGHALPDGSFPIENKQDLHNAIQAIGRAKNPAKAKAHIKARARALGATDMLPDSWKSEEPSDVFKTLAEFKEIANKIFTRLDSIEKSREDNPKKAPGATNEERSNTITTSLAEARSRGKETTPTDAQKQLAALELKKAGEFDEKAKRAEQGAENHRKLAKRAQSLNDTDAANIHDGLANASAALAKRHKIAADECRSKAAQYEAAASPQAKGE